MSRRLTLILCVMLIISNVAAYICFMYVNNNAFLSFSALSVNALMLVYVFNKLVRKELNSLSDLISCVEKIGKGNISNQIKVNKSTSNEVDMVFVELEVSRNNFNKTISNAIDSLTKMTEIDVASTKVVQGFVANSEREVQEIEQIATAATELSATASEVANNAIQADRATGAMNDTIQNGFQVLSRSQAISEEVSTSIDQAFTICNDLRNYAAEINDVVEMISAVSEQTNLLALNAAIEAARAGDLGRGFAVVAEEVRALAERTQQSTIKIKEIVIRLQEKSTDADLIMSQNRELICESQAVAEELNVAFDVVSQEVEQISSVVAQVASASEEQSTVTADISVRINEMSQFVEENIQNVYTARNGMQKRGEIMRVLNKELEYFTV